MFQRKGRYKGMCRFRTCPMRVATRGPTRKHLISALQLKSKHAPYELPLRSCRRPCAVRLRSCRRPHTMPLRSWLRSCCAHRAPETLNCTSLAAHAPPLHCWICAQTDLAALRCNSPVVLCLHRLRANAADFLGVRCPGRAQTLKIVAASYLQLVQT